LNPLFVGRSSRLLRKLVPTFFAYITFAGFNSYYKNYKSIYTLKFYEHYPPHVRQYLQTKDHRYLLLFDMNNSPYKLWDSDTKKALY